MGVPDKRRGSTPTPEGVDDIVSASAKAEEWSEDDISETCRMVATSGEQNHGLLSYKSIMMNYAGRVTPVEPVDSVPRNGAEAGSTMPF